MLSIIGKNYIFSVSMALKKFSLVCVKNVVHFSLIRLVHYFNKMLVTKAYLRKKKFSMKWHKCKRSWSDISIFDCNPTEEGVRNRNENAMQM